MNKKKKKENRTYLRRSLCINKVADHTTTLDVDIRINISNFYVLSLYFYPFLKPLINFFNLWILDLR
jgi:hypothetical protein